MKMPAKSKQDAAERIRQIDKLAVEILKKHPELSFSQAWQRVLDSKKN